jgi:hypothetical protein
MPLLITIGLALIAALVWVGLRPAMRRRYASAVSARSRYERAPMISFAGVFSFPPASRAQRGKRPLVAARQDGEWCGQQKQPRQLARDFLISLGGQQVGGTVASAGMGTLPRGKK